MPHFPGPRELGAYVAKCILDAEDGVEEGAEVGLENGRVGIDWRAGHNFSGLDKTEIANTFVTTAFGDCDEQGREAFIEGFEGETEEGDSVGF